VADWASCLWESYCETDGVSLDWLYVGELKHLQRMMQVRRVGAPTPESLREKLSRPPIRIRARRHPQDGGSTHGGAT